ncbi:MAG: PIG-L family deacetylase [Comamonadaceae bacterium]|nr:MAG: PIG-L family deacetylase [Comamonadaceae bacterium]
MDAVADRVIEGRGTSEAEWLGAPGLHELPRVTAELLVPSGHRAVMVAPHPDDEVLAVGGLLSHCVAIGRELRLVAVTDGCASHAGSHLWPPERLARERPLESEEAWRRLGLAPRHGAASAAADCIRLGLPDGGLAEAVALLTERLAALLRPTDVVFTTWRLDGHPDHEATARACVEAVARTGARLVEVPVWAWHWSRPGDARWPWHRARRIELDDATLQRKRHAVEAFTSQLMPDVSTGAGPILRDTTVQRAARPFEVVFA